MPSQTPLQPNLAASRGGQAGTETVGSAESSVLYPLKDISLMVKTYSHDLRNTLNGMDLDLTLLSESNSDPNLQEAIQRLQSTAVEIGRQVQGLIAKYAAEMPFEIPIIQLAERWKLDIQLTENGPPLHWNVDVGGELVYGEAALIRNLLLEMFLVSQRIAPRKPLHLGCVCKGDEAVFEIRVAEPPAETRRVQLQQTYWQALRRLAERADGRLLPEELDEIASLTLQLIVRPHRNPHQTSALS